MTNEIDLCSFKSVIERDFISNWTNERKSKVYILTESELIKINSLYISYNSSSCATTTMLPLNENCEKCDVLAPLRRDYDRNESIGKTLTAPLARTLVIGNSYIDKNNGLFTEYNEDIFLFDLINRIKIKYTPNEFVLDFPQYKNTHTGDKSHFKRLVQH
jgi:hypothetical protein